MSEQHCGSIPGKARDRVVCPAGAAADMYLRYADSPRRSQAMWTGAGLGTGISGRSLARAMTPDQYSCGLSERHHQVHRETGVKRCRHYRQKEPDG